MGSLQHYRYDAEFQYINVAKGTYERIFQESIKWIIIDKDYEKYNMPLVFASITIDKRLADDMIINYRENLINVQIQKFAYDSDDEFYMNNKCDEEYIYGQFEYFTDDKINDNDEIDYATEENEERKDIYRTITIGLMKLSLINQNKKRFNMTLMETTMTNALMTVTRGLEDLVMEPLTYDEVIPQLILPSTDSISKMISALNQTKVFYSTPYRFFMDFDATYLLSSDGTSVKRKGQNITDVLIVVKKTTDSAGMTEGVYLNRSEKCYQINIGSNNVDIRDNHTIEKSVTQLVAIQASGEKQEASLDIDTSSTNTDKVATITIPNENINMIKNIKAQTETGASYVCIVKDNIDSELININSITVMHHLDENVAYNGQYLLARKREILMNNGYDFNISVVATYKKLRKVV